MPPTPREVLVQSAAAQPSLVLAVLARVQDCDVVENNCASFPCASLPRALTWVRSDQTRGEECLVHERGKDGNRGPLCFCILGEGCDAAMELAVYITLSSRMLGL